jgi:hypothetical protein
MADDIMPEEAARRRRAGELRRLGMRYPVTPTPIDEAIERQRAASREFMKQQLAAERALVRSGERLPVPASGGGGAMLPPTGRDLMVPGSDRPLSAGEPPESRAVSNRSRMTINPTMPSARSVLPRALGPAAVAADIVNPNPVADATLRGNPGAGIPAYGGTRFNDEAPASPRSNRGSGVGEGGTPQGRGRAAPYNPPPSEFTEANSRRRQSYLPAETADMAPQPYEETTSEMRDLLNQRAAERDRARNRSNTRGRPRETPPAERDTLEQVALGAVLGDMMKGGDVQPEPGFLERLGLRRTNETGEGRASTGSIREDVRALGRTLGLKKGGKVKKMASGGVVKSSASRRGDGIAARGKTKGRMV